MKHVSLETAKKLKKIGWEKPCEFYMGVNMPDGFYITPGREEVNWKLMSRSCTTLEYDGLSDTTIEYYQLPTCEELLEVLPVHHNYGVPVVNKANGGEDYAAHYLHWGELWETGKKAHLVKELPTFLGKTAAEALALLLIELVEQGVISKESLSSQE